MTCPGEEELKLKFFFIVLSTTQLRLFWNPVMKLKVSIFSGEVESLYIEGDQNAETNGLRDAGRLSGKLKKYDMDLFCKTEKSYF